MFRIPTKNCIGFGKYADKCGNHASTPLGLCDRCNGLRWAFLDEKYQEALRRHNHSMLLEGYEYEEQKDKGIDTGNE